MPPNKLAQRSWCFPRRRRTRPLTCSKPQHRTAMVPPICPTMSTATTIRSGLAQILHRQHIKPSLRWGVCTVSSSFQDSYCGATGQHHVICSPHAHRRRWQSSDSTAGTPDIPAPTWSVSNLRLKADPSDPDDTISEEELYKLAYRCLIDVRTLPQEERDALRRDLAGIMRRFYLRSSSSIDRRYY